MFLTTASLADDAFDRVEQFIGLQRRFAELSAPEQYAEALDYVTGALIVLGDFSPARR